MATDLDFFLPSNWWHDPQIAEPVNLSTAQYERLDRLHADRDDVIRRDLVDASRAFRDTISSRGVTAAQIEDAGRRLRDARNAEFERQVEMLAAQREILTDDQWRRLQDAVATAGESRREEFRGRRPERGGRRPGGRGGRFP